MWATWAAFAAPAAIIVLLLWFAVPAIRALHADSNCADLWTTDALLHLPVLSLLLLLWLLSFDVRFPRDFCFSPRVAIASIILLLASHLCLVISGSKSSLRALSINAFQRNAKLLWGMALAIIVLVGLGIRAYGLLDASFAHDEASMARFSRGILTNGFPHVINGSFTKWLTTYELVPYPLALSSLVLGPSVLAYRLPALIFGTLTIALIGWIGYRLFDLRVGLIAALIYAFAPSSVAWARDGFYPSQQGFFALLTFGLFYEVLRDAKELNYRYVKLAALAFVCTYLSWEGSGFILPSLFITLVVMRWDSFDWIRDRHLWRWAAIVTALVIVQLCLRQLLMVPDYLGIGYDLSEVTSPTLVFLKRNLFKPLYYAREFFGAENRVVLSVFALGGICALRGSRPLRYLWLLLGTLELCYMALLPNYAPRYYFQAEPLLILAGVGSLFYFADALRAAEPATCPAYVRWARSCGTWMLLVLVVLSSNPYFLKVYRLGADETAPPLFERVGVDFKANYRDADLYVAQHLRPGDIVITREPHVYAYYTGRAPDYSTDTLLNSRLFYDAGTEQPRYIDKWYGVPSLRTLQEVLALQARHGRSWIIKSKGCRFEYDLLSRSFLADWGQSVFESSCEEVVLLTGTPGQSGSTTMAPALKEGGGVPGPHESSARLVLR